MTKENTFDPFAIWREQIDRLESSVNTFATSNMESEQFAKALALFLRASLGAHHVFDENLAKLYQRLNLPSRTEVAALAAVVQRIEEKLDMLLPATPSVPRPARTRPILRMLQRTDAATPAHARNRATKARLSDEPSTQHSRCLRAAAHGSRPRDPA